MTNATDISARSSGIIFAALMPHAPVLIPDVGRDQLGAVASSVRAMTVLAARLAARKPQAVVVISPHSPRRRSEFGVWTGTRLQGNFSQFGASHTAVDLPNATALSAEIKAQAPRFGLQTWEISGQPLDHGALVPLWYLVKAGWDGPTMVLGLNCPQEGELTQLGHVLSGIAKRLGRPIAIVASGDLSHRLTVNAPAGYEPRARDFDRKFIGCLRRGAYRELESFAPLLEELAGEDALDSTIVALAAANWQAKGHKVLSYEGPFGVGYGVAVLFDSGAGTPRLESLESRPKLADTLPLVARESLKATLFETTEQVPPPEGCLASRHGVFVTIRGPDGRLRGCVGTLSPGCQNVVDETRRLACVAAFSDGRFPPVTWEEFPSLRLEVSDVVSMEEVSSEADMDPERYGAVVSTSDGREGCLLPGLPSIRTVEQQLAFARLKGGIQDGEPVRLRRFKTASFQEAEAIRPGGFMFRPIMDSSYPARWWTMLPDGRTECQLCPRRCKLQEGQRGFCFVRQRLDNHIVLTAYGRSSGFCIDPIEKKPLNHFYPGTSVLSFGTAGCNLGCRFCQNWAISKARESDRRADEAAPQTIAKAARRLGCKAVAFTYNDPVIFAEYAIDTALACHDMGVQTVAVTAGYMNPNPRAEFYQHIDAANVDLKGFTENFYRKLCFGQLAPVLETLDYLHHETEVWLEVTSLLIPGENDSEKQLDWATDWFAEHLGPDVPWHFTAFHPDFKMLDNAPTPLATLEKARTIALSKGLRYVYTGNVDYPAGASTSCPRCQRVLIERNGYEIGSWNLAAGCCAFCGLRIPGRFENQPGNCGGRRISVRLN